MRKHFFRGAIITSVVVVLFGMMFHYYNVTPHDWGAVALWLPVYISPIWAISGFSWFTQRKDK